MHLRNTGGVPANLNGFHLPRLVGIPAACDALSLSRTTVYGLIGRGELDARKIGKRRLVTADSIRRLVESGS